MEWDFVTLQPSFIEYQIPGSCFGPYPIPAPHLVLPRGHCRVPAPSQCTGRRCLDPSAATATIAALSGKSGTLFGTDYLPGCCRFLPPDAHAKDSDIGMLSPDLFQSGFMDGVISTASSTHRHCGLMGPCAGGCRLFLRSQHVRWGRVHTIANPPLRRVGSLSNFKKPFTS